MVWYKDRTLGLFLTTMLAANLVAEYYFSIPLVKFLGDYSRSVTIVISAFILTLVVITGVRYHTKTMMTRKKGQWYLSLWFLIILTVMSITGIFGGDGNQIYSFIYSYIYGPAEATMAGTLALFIFSASYRAFKARSTEATVMLLSTIIILLSNTPLGTAIWGQIPVIGAWIQNTIAMGGTRGLNVTMAIALVALIVRIFVGLEKGYITK